jgi:hypothetical protein
MVAAAGAPNGTTAALTGETGPEAALDGVGSSDTDGGFDGGMMPRSGS